MKVLSLRDLMLCEELSHISNEVMLVHPSNDKLVASLIEKVGFDVNKEWYYTASYHRDMQNKPAIGYQVVGEFSTKPEYKHLLTTFERVVVAGMQDKYLAQDMMEIMGKRFNYNNQDEYEIGPKKRKPDPRYYSQEQLDDWGYDDSNDEEVYEDVVEDSEVISKQIETLQKVLYSVREGV